MYVVRLDLYEALELRIPAARTLEKVMVKLRWGNNKVLERRIGGGEGGRKEI